MRSILFFIKNNITNLNLKILVSCLAAFFSQISIAAIPSAKVQTRNVLNMQGALYGGVAGNGFSLMKMEKVLISSQNIERWIVDVGNLKGKPNKGLPGYYHVQLNSNPAQLVIDFSQMPSAKFTDIELAKLIRTSSTIKSGRLLSDPTDKTLTMILDLKKPSQVKVSQVRGLKQTSKVVLDFSL